MRFLKFVATDGVGLLNSLVGILNKGISSASGSTIFLLSWAGGSPCQTGNLDRVEWFPFLLGIAGLNALSWSGSRATVAWDSDGLSALSYFFGAAAL